MKIRTSAGAFARLALCLGLLIATGVACAGVKALAIIRREFSSADWLAGDKIERGRMAMDMYCNEFIKCKADVSTREQAVKTLGEPDLKKTIEGREVWFYRVDLGIAGNGPRARLVRRKRPRPRRLLPRRNKVDDGEGE